MPSLPKKSWKYEGCHGRFYVRGKHIWYELHGKKTSTGLVYTPENRIMAGVRQKATENPLPEKIQSPGPVMLSAAFSEFLKNRCKNLEKRTKFKYINMFGNLFSSDFFLDDIDSIKDNIKENLKNTENTARTMNKYIIQLKTFGRYCLENKWIDENFYEKGMEFKETKKVIEVWSDDELAGLLNYFNESNPKFSIFLNLLYKTSFRVMEMANLTKKQILLPPYYSHNSEVENRKYRNDIMLWKNKAGTEPEKFPLADTLIVFFNQLELPDDENISIFGYDEAAITYLRRFLDDAMDDIEIPKHTSNDIKGRGRSYHTFRKTKITHWLFKDKLTPAQVSKLSRDTIQTIMKYYAAFDVEDFKQYV